MPIIKYSNNTIRINLYIRIVSFFLLLYFGSLTHWLIAISVYIIKGLLFTSVVHRGLSHKSFKMNKWVERSLASISLSGMNYSVLVWVAVHRQHHKFTDKPGDPHSPHLTPFWSIHMPKSSETVNLQYAPDLLRQPFYKLMHKYHWDISYTITLLLFLIDPMLMLSVWLVPNFLQWFSASTANVINHTKFGYRNFNTDDISYNNWFTGICCFGEGWHNNHHHDSKNPNFGVKWWEFDSGWWLIKLIRTDK